MTNKLSSKNIMVVGGAGFIGSHLVDRIIRERPKKIVIVDNLYLGRMENLQEAKLAYPSLKFYQQDASDYDSMKTIISKEETDVIFNLAVIPLPASLEKPKLNLKNNIGITLTLCELIKEKFFKTFIHFSSSEVYGTARYLPIDESHPLKPHTPYAASKAACDHIVISYNKTFGVDAAIVRPFNTYGPRQNALGGYAAVIPTVINSIVYGKPVFIHGDGKQTRDFSFVTDIADAAVRTYKSPKTRGAILNVATEKEVTVNGIVKEIIKITESKPKVVHTSSRPGDVRRFLGSYKLASKLIDFKPKTDLRSGLRKTISWYLKHLNNGKK